MQDKKKLIWIIVATLLMVLTFRTVLSMSESLSMADLMEALRSSNHIYLTLAVISMCAYIAFKGEAIRLLLKTFPDMKVLGLSATPIRYLDNQRDMADELFDNCIADCMTLGEAIARGILPAPKYVVSLYTIDKESDNYDDALKTYRNRIQQG